MGEEITKAMTLRQNWTLGSSHPGYKAQLSLVGPIIRCPEEWLETIQMSVLHLENREAHLGTSAVL